MSLYNELYKAINEGIIKSLIIDPEQNDVSVNYSHHKINNSIDFSKDFVDLGLSVEWAKYNIGATCENTPESWYGNYYAWGELQSKQVYNEESYDQILYETYNKNTLHILQPEDDIVTQTYYGLYKFRMPTIKEIKELLDETKITNEWKEDYQGIENLNGRLFTSKITGNSIFIPAADYIYGEEVDSPGSGCSLWSSIIDSNYQDSAQSLNINFNNIYLSTSHRYYGLSVRGVCS